MLLGFEMYYLKNICFSNVIIIGNFFTPVNVLFDNYLHYCIHVPVYFNCMNVLSSAFHQIDFFVLHVYTLFNDSRFIHMYGEEKYWGQGKLNFSSHSILHNLWKIYNQRLLLFYPE